MEFNKVAGEALENKRDEMYYDLTSIEQNIIDLEIRREKTRKELYNIEDKLGYIPGVGMTDVDLVDTPDTTRIMFAGKDITYEFTSSKFYSESDVTYDMNEHWHGAEGVELHKAIGVYLAGVYTKKNSDYGDAFGKSLDKHGMKAAVVRMEDKLGRLDSLTSGTEQQVFDEKLEDTVLDLANYAIMTAMYMIEKGRE